MARLNGTIDTDSYDVSAWRGYRGETGFTVGSSIHLVPDNPLHPIHKKKRKRKRKKGYEWAIKK